MNVRLVSITKPEIVGPSDRSLTAEELLTYCARVSNPENQHNTKTSSKLIKFLIDNKHWSPFEMVDMTVEIKTSRAIAQQILRHRSFSFQEFSQRYSTINELEPIELRMKAEKNRQSSSDLVPEESCHYTNAYKVLQLSQEVYSDLVRCGVAKECARMVLPLCTQTTMYMKGSIRSWIHYLQIRCDDHTQKEHREIANNIRNIFIPQFPNIARALEWERG